MLIRRLELVLVSAAIAVLPWFLVRVMPWRIRPIPLLWLASIVVLVLLLRSEHFRNRELWNAGALRSGLKPVLLRWVVAVGLLFGAVLAFIPESLFEFPKEAPLIWMMVMVLYPIFSVYPQGILMRCGFIHRYRSAFSATTAGAIAFVVTTAVAFSAMHLLMGTWQALALTFVGGLLFTTTHLKHRSLLLSSVEHALYGQALFTLGLGEYLYHGSLTATGG